jgi:hypothetical protein
MLPYCNECKELGLLQKVRCRYGYRLSFCKSSFFNLPIILNIYSIFINRHSRIKPALNTPSIIAVKSFIYWRIGENFQVTAAPGALVYVCMPPCFHFCPLTDNALVQPPR